MNYQSETFTSGGRQSWSSVSAFVRGSEHEAVAAGSANFW